jgi:hypothetical protein
VGLASCPNCGQDEQIVTPPRYEPLQVSIASTPFELALGQAEQLSPETPHYDPLGLETEPEASENQMNPESAGEMFAEAEEEAEVAAPSAPEEVAPPAVESEPAPVVKVLNGPPPIYKRRRRHRPPTLKERLAYRLEQLRGASQDATRKVAPKVEQLRETSNIVLDRADTDPSARFLLIGLLLIAIAAFVFFVSFFWG